MSDAVSRILRTLVQAGGATVIVTIILAFVTLTDKQAAALTAGITWLFAIVQNAIESKTGTKLLAPSADS